MYCHLIQAENRRRIKDLHDEPSSQQGADEGAASSEQTRPPQHDRRDRAERVTSALTRITTELPQKDDCTEERSGDAGGIQKRDPGDWNAGAPRRLLVGSHRTQPKAESTPPERELER